MKKIICLVAAALLSLSMLFVGCSDGRDGRDGKDGQNVTIDEIYDKYVAEYGETSFEDFLKEYLSYTDGDLNSASSLRATINRSLMSGVSILTKFAYTSARPLMTSYKVYTGSGAILWLDKIAGDAYVVTNCHVIYDDSSDSVYCEDIRLYLYGQDTAGVNFVLSGNKISNDENYRIPAEIVGASQNYDIALLKVTGSDVLKRSDSVAVSNNKSVTGAMNDSFVSDASACVGETVYAIGNASGEGMSAASGIVAKDSENIYVGLSTLDKNSSYSYRVLRTTAPINHGNSGGALYNTSGKIVGIVNAKDEGEDVDNMGYALPANMVRRLVVSIYDSYVANGNKPISGPNGEKCGFKKAMLNVQTSVADSFARLNEDGIAVITELVKVAKIDGAPAAGVLRVGDILMSAKLTSADGTVKEDIAITRNYCLSEMLISARVGDSLTLRIERGKTQTDVSLKFEASYFKYMV